MIADIYEDYEKDSAFESLRKPGIRFVPGIGPLNPDIMLVGEAPGELENSHQEPFVGKAGRFLDQLLEKMDVFRERVYITNAIKYWPTNDEGKTRSPTPKELRYSQSYLLEEILTVNPRIVGLCGHSAITCIFPQVTNVNEVHAQLLGNMYVPLYHPAQMGYKPLMAGKMLKGYKMLNEYLLQKDNSE